MSVATGRSVSVALTANATAYIAAMRQATAATNQLQAALRASSTASTQMAAATARASTAAATASAAAATTTTASTAASATAARSAAASAASTNRTLQSIGTRTAAVGAGMLLAIGAAAVAFARFEKQMSAVKAVTNATTTEMDALSAAAIKMGAATVFSASDAARAEGELAKVGITVADILGGALQGSLALAAAGQLDLARAAEVAGQSMKIFNLEGQDVGRVADALANGANKSAADVEQLAQALAQGGLVAAQTGLDLEDTVGTLALFADNALIGSDAGTSLKTMLQRLTPTSQEAAREMERLGISAYDAQGNFIGIEALAGQLQTTMAGLTVEQRNAALATIFGSDAVRAANVLYKEGAEGVRDYVDATSEVGTAALVAATQMDNLAGDIEELKGAFETGLIQAGSESNSVLREMVQNLTEVVRWFNDLPGPVRQGITQFLITAGVLTLVGGGLLTLTTRVMAARVAFVALTAASPALAAALVTVAKAAAVALAIFAAVSALGALTSASNKPVPGLEATTQALLDLGKEGRNISELNTLFHDLGVGVNDIDTFGQALDEVNSKNFTDSIHDTIAGLTGFDSSMKNSEDAIAGLGEALALLVQSGNADAAAVQFEKLAAEAAAHGTSVDELMALMPAYDDALKAQANSQELASTSAKSVVEAVAGIAPTTEEATEALDALDATLRKLFDKAFSVEEATDAYAQSLRELTTAAEENGTSTGKNTEAAAANRAALRDSADAALGLIGTMAQQGATSEEVTAKTAELKKSLYDAAIQAGFSQEAAAQYSGVLDEVPAVVETAIGLTGVATATSQLSTLMSRLSEFDGRVYTSTVRTINTTTGRTRTETRTGQAEGGYISGPGGPREDLIPAYLSNGEYVIKAAAVAKYGREFFDRANQMRFATGGFVGQSPVSTITNGPSITVNATADAPLAHRYAQEVADRAVVRLRDAAAVHGISWVGA